MGNQLVVSSDAIADIDNAVNYDNKISYGLGFEFAETLDRYFKILLSFPLLLL